MYNSRIKELYFCVNIYRYLQYCIGGGGNFPDGATRQILQAFAGMVACWHGHRLSLLPQQANAPDVI